MEEEPKQENPINDLKSFLERDKELSRQSAIARDKAEEAIRSGASPEEIDELVRMYREEKHTWDEFWKKYGDLF